MIRAAFVCTVPIMICWIIMSAAADEKKAPEKQDKSAKKAAAAKAPAKAKAPVATKKRKEDYLEGKLLQVEGTQRYITVQVTVRIPQPNPQAAANMASYQQQLRTAKDIGTIQNLRLQMARESQNLVSYREESQKLEFTVNDDMKVRNLLPPVDFDSKGRRKKLSDKELKELRGPENLPGFPADFDSLKPGQLVRIYLEKSKEKVNQKSKVKEKDLIADPKVKQKVRSIIILGEPPK